MFSDELEGAGGAQSAPAATPPDGAPGLSDEKTLRYAPADQKTIQQAPHTIRSPSKTPQPQHGASISGGPPSKTLGSSVAGETGPATLSIGLSLQDLSTERLLLSAPRTESHGRHCPTLNGIPLLAKIGQGGMGAVYYGIHPRLRNEVAVKVLPFQLAEQDPGTIKRFFREAQLAAQVHSPHLVNVTDVNEEAGLFFLVMEYVSGCSAGQYLKLLLEKGAKGLSELDALEVTIAATEGLWAAHANNIVHRDIKPDNIMIPYQSRTTKDVNLQSAKLMDLGLARNEDSQQSLTGNQSAMGTPGYMAPEQAMDAKSADKRSDVFSMGATLYALLSGHSPFKGETVMKVLMATMHEPHTPISEVRKDICPAVNDLLEKCLSKKPSNRYSDARQLLGALQDCRRLLTDGGGGGESFHGGGSTLVYEGARARAKTPAPGTLVGSSVEKTGIGLAAEAQASGTAPTPSPKPKPKALVLVSAVLGAALVLGGVAYFAIPGKTGQGKPDDVGKPLAGDVQKRLAEVDAKLDKFLVEEADAELTSVQRDFPNEPGIDARRQKIEDLRGDVVEAGKNLELVRQAIKQARETGDSSALSKVAMKLRMAKKLAPNYPAVSAVAQDYEKAKTELGDKEGLRQKQQNFDDLLTETSVLLTNREKLGDAETKLNSAKEMFPQDERLKKLLAELEQKKKDVTAFKAAMRYAGLALDAGDLAEAESRLADAKKVYPEDQQVKALQVSLDGKRKAARDAETKTRETFDGLIAQANTLIESNKLAEVDPKIREAARLFPDDPAIAAARKKLFDKQDVAQREAAAKQTRQIVLADLDAILKADNLSEAKRQLEAAEAAYKQDKEVEAFRVIYDKKKQQADEQSKRKDFDGILANVDDLFAKKADLFEIENALDQAKKLIPDDPQLASREQRLQERRAEEQRKIEEQQKRARFDDLLKKVQETVDKDGSLDDAQAKLDSAKALIPDDAKLGELLKLVAEKRADRELKILKDIGAALDKGELDAAGKLIADAEADNPGEYLLKVRETLKQRKQALASAQRERDTAFAGVTQALGPTGDLAEAQRLFEAFKAKYPNDAEIVNFDGQLQKKAQKHKDFAAQITLADAAAKKGDYQGAESYLATAKGILGDAAASRTVETKRGEYKALQADAAKSVVTDALAKVKQALNTNPADLAAAIKPAQDAHQAYPTNVEIESVRSALIGLQTAEASVRQTAALADQKIAEFRKNDKVASKDEFKQLTAARDRLVGLVPGAASQLATSSFKDSDAVLRGLDQNRQSAAGEISRLEQRLEELAKASKSSGSVGEQNPFDDPPKKKPEPPPPVKKSKRNGSAGELNPFDE